MAQLKVVIEMRVVAKLQAIANARGISVRALAAEVLTELADSPVKYDELFELARAYSNGEVTAAQVAEKTGASLGELLRAVRLQNLPLPQAVADKNQLQIDLYKVLDQAARAERPAESN